MKDFLTAMGMSLSMFTVLPLPVSRWDERLRKLSTACLPLVGLLLGAIWLGLAYLAQRFLPAALAAALTAALPFLLTGFIHLDGFLDTSDAVFSWREQEERVRILKDVHAGSFAVVMMSMLMLFQFAACFSLKALLPLLLIPLLSRAGSAFCVLALKKLGHSEYASEAQENPGPLKGIVCATAAAALIALLLVSGLRGLLAGVCTLAGYALSMRWTYGMLGGMSGDLAGFSLTVAELCGLIALAV